MFYQLNIILKLNLMLYSNIVINIYLHTFLSITKTWYMLPNW